MGNLLYLQDESHILGQPASGYSTQAALRMDEAR